MNRLVKILMLVIPFSFLMGTWWSLRSLEQRLQGPRRNGKELRLLYRRGYLSPQTLSDFTTLSGLQISGHAVDSDLALWDEVNERPASYDLIQISSYMAKELISSKIFAELNPELANHFIKVSNEFTRLPFDLEFSYTMPIAWGINGFLWNKKIAGPPPSHLRLALENPSLKDKIYLLPQEWELFSLMTNNGFAFKDWLDQEKWEDLSLASRSFFEHVHVPSQPIHDLWRNEKVAVMQLANGPAAEILSQSDLENTLYWLPDEKNNLWISLIGISRTSSLTKEAHEFLAYLQEDEAIKTMVEFNGQATAMIPSKLVHLKPMQQASYIRQIKLTNIHLLTDTTSLSPIWYRTLAKTLPQAFGQTDQNKKIGSDSVEPDDKKLRGNLSQESM